MESDIVLRRLFRLSLMVTLCLMAGLAQAQTTPDTTTLYRIQTVDGNEYVGNIIQQNEEFILLKTKNLVDITITRKSIKTMVAIEGANQVGDEFWFENPQATRYFWQSNGFGLKKGEFYYQNALILVNQVGVGITDNISMDVGIVPGFLFLGPSMPAWITAKFSVPIAKDKFSLGGGALVGSVLGESNQGFGIVYGVGTVGNRNRNASLGVGYSYRTGARNPTITFSGMYRTGKNGYLLTENYIISGVHETVTILSFGGRRIISIVGLDFGLFSLFYSEANNFRVRPRP